MLLHTDHKTADIWAGTDLVLSSSFLERSASAWPPLAPAALDLICAVRRAISSLLVRLHTHIVLRQYLDRASEPASGQWFDPAVLPDAARRAISSLLMRLRVPGNG